MEYIVGRNGNQPFEITDSKVSKEHLKVESLPDGKFRIEDLNSSNGTFVDGNQIVKKIVDAETEIMLGDEFLFRCNMLIDTFEEEFLKLKKVYDDYSNNKVKLQKTNSLRMTLRMAIPPVFGVIGIIIGVVAGSEGLIISAISAIATLIAVLFAMRSSSKMPEQMAALKKDFQIRYVCPNCHRFLGFLPFESIQNLGACPSCKKKWPKTK